MRGNRGYIAVAILLLVLIAVVNTKLPTYWRPYSGLNYGTILRTCVSGDPRFNFLDVLREDKEVVNVAVPVFDVAIACTLRAFAGQRLLRSDRAGLTALEHLIAFHPSCAELPAVAADACQTAHFETIDWLIRAGFDVNGEKVHGGTYLLSAVTGRDKAMFAFLLSRGADPAYVPPLRAQQERPVIVLEVLEVLAAGRLLGDEPNDTQLWREMLLLALNRPLRDGN